MNCLHSPIHMTTYRKLSGMQIIPYRIISRIFMMILIIPCFLSSLAAQENNSRPDSINTSLTIHGSVADKKTGTPLPYANIYALKSGKGVISNEKGQFTMDIGDLADSDSIRFQYIGYKTMHITAVQLAHNAEVLMEEEIINLSETIVYGSMPDIVSIVKNVLKYKDSNYVQITNRQQVFIRDRDMADLEQFVINFRKSSIEQLDREVIEGMEQRFPKYMTSYNDFLGNIYFSANSADSIRMKVDPVRAVSLKQEDMEVFEQMNTIFESLVENTGEDEYWKVRSGIFGEKLDLDEDTTSRETDSLKDFRTNVDLYRGKIGYQRKFSTFGNEDDWEFLYKTGRYNYTLIGGTRVNGEEVYIIDFNPRGNGRYEGRMFIAA
ncbi:MAG: carboxypeptidase-like regulatory domain-containing protein, partial [bacterium]